MNYLKKLIKPLLISFLTLFLSIFFFTLLEYIGWIGNNTFKVMSILICTLGFMISGVVFGKRSSKRGWLEGVKLSFIEILILILINLSINTTNIKNVIIYSIIFIATTLGSIIGVNKNGLVK